jgi:hypothetical protein
MITDIPTPEQILNVGLRFMSTAWGDTLSTAINAKNAPFDDSDGEYPKPEEFWNRASNDLAVALATAQQGVEFLLKAGIAKFSPFLLIGQEPAKWPKGCDKQDVKFTDFRAIDSQDLIRVYNTVADKKRLPDEFVTKFESMRKHRNVVFHTVPCSLTTAVLDIVEAVLEATNTLVEPFAWPRLRKKVLNESPWSLFPDFEDWDIDVLNVNAELAYVLDILEPTAAKKLLGLEKKQRLYACPECYYSYRGASQRENFKLAQLRPKGSSSTSLFCIACEGKFTVVRENCKEEDCKGNVLSDDGLCLTCTNNQ